jgi:hypothetical protein
LRSVPFDGQVVGGKSIMLLDATDGEKPLELAFLPKYGNVTCHRWISHDKMIVGFHSGSAPHPSHPPTTWSELFTPVSRTMIYPADYMKNM